MEKLNDDCLFYIFYNLHFFERVRAEVVCKKWCRILHVRNLSFLKI